MSTERVKVRGGSRTPNTSDGTVAAKVSSICYDDSASIPTGMDGGGKRLRVYSGKIVEEDIRGIIERESLLLKMAPQVLETNTIPIPWQYILQAQSWLDPHRIFIHWKKSLCALAPNSNERKQYNDRANSLRYEFESFFAENVSKRILEMLLNHEKSTNDLTAGQNTAEIAEESEIGKWRKEITEENSEKEAERLEEVKKLFNLESMVTEIWKLINAAIKEKIITFPEPQKQVIEEHKKIISHQ